MTNGTKFAVAGCAAGTAAASVPLVYGLAKNLKPKPLDENDFLHTQDGGFVAANGAKVWLRGINLSDEIFFIENGGAPLNPGNYEAFALFEERFGRYGARKLIGNYYQNLVSVADLKLIKKLGANCVRIPLRYKYLFRKENCKGDIDFDYLDKLVEKCRKNGLYVIFDLHSAPGGQNNLSLLPDEKSVLFDSSKDGFEARNAVVRIWSQIAAHYKDEPAVAAYDLLNRPLAKTVDWERCVDTLHKLYRRVYKAIRNVDPEHIVIMQAANSPDTLPEAAEYKNVAYGLYWHFNTTFETDSLIAAVNKLKSRNIPFVVSKIRCDGSWDYSLSALCDSGISWIAGDFKAATGACALYTADVEKIVFEDDNYDVMTEKWSKPLATKNFTVNKEMKALLKEFFGRGYVYIEPTEGGKKPKHLNLRFGKSTLIGNTRENKRRAGQ